MHDSIFVFVLTLISIDKSISFYIRVNITFMRIPSSDTRCLEIVNCGLVTVQKCKSHDALPNITKISY